LAEGRVGAEAAYDSVLSVDPTNTRALLGRGYTRAAQGKYDSAILDFQLAQREGEGRSGALTGLGYVALRRNDLAGAAAQFQDALRIDPGAAAAATGLAYTEVWRVDPRQATHRTDALANPRPTSYAPAAADHLRAGIAYFGARNTRAAEQALTAAAAAAPAWADVYFTRALVLQAEGQSSQAIADFRRYLQLRPNASDRDDVAERIAALGRSPGAAFAYGLLPGGGQFYTKQPVLGVVVLGGVAASGVWAMQQTTTTETRTFTDPFGRVDTFTVSVSHRKNLAAGAAIAGALWLGGAIQAALHVASARGDPYPTATPGSAPRRSASLPTLQPVVGVDPVTGAPRWGLALRFAIR
jgi:Tfp pilus assembly protein PilF